MKMHGGSGFLLGLLLCNIRIDDALFAQVLDNRKKFECLRKTTPFSLHPYRAIVNHILASRCCISFFVFLKPIQRAIEKMCSLACIYAIFALQSSFFPMHFYSDDTTSLSLCLYFSPRPHLAHSSILSMSGCHGNLLPHPTRPLPAATAAVSKVHCCCLATSHTVFPSNRTTGGVCQS